MLVSRDAPLIRGPPAWAPSQIPAWALPSLPSSSATIFTWADTRLGAAVISKPPGVRTQRGGGPRDEDSVAAALGELGRRFSSISVAPGAGIMSGHVPPALRLVHRLDARVSGLLLLAATRAAAAELSRSLSDAGGAVRKIYVGVARGAPASIKQIRALGGGVVSDDVEHDGLPQSAVSRWRVVEGKKAARPHSSRVALLLEPITGRKHQLRQHAVKLFRAAGGHGALVGDSRYGDGAGHEFIALHAAAIRLQPGSLGAAQVEAIDIIDSALPNHVAVALESAGVSVRDALAAAAAFSTEKNESSGSLSS